MVLPMLRRTVIFSLEAAELSYLIFFQYITDNGFLQDIVFALCSMDSALFNIGFRKPLALLNVFQHSLALKCSERFFESIAAGVCCCMTQKICLDAATHFFTYRMWQDEMFERMYPTRLLRWIGRRVTPNVIRKWFDVSRTQSEIDARKFACDFHVSQYDESVVRGVVATNLVADAAHLISDQCRWAAIYWNEVLRRHQAAKAQEEAHITRMMLFRRTFKSHVASTTLSLVEIGLHLTTRILGAAAGRKVYPTGGLGAFWGEHVLLCLASPVLERAAHFAAAVMYQALEKILPSTEADAEEDAREQEEMHSHEAENRDHYLATQHSNDLYDVLGVPSSASEADVKRAYRNLALKYHPDRVSHLPEAEKQQAQKAMSTINEAYEVLSSETKRSTYDASRMFQYDTDNPPEFFKKMQNLPLAVQIVGAHVALFGSLYIGGAVLYAHLSSHFRSLSSLGRTPMRTMCH